MTPLTDEIAVHICPMCRKDVASGRDAVGLPALCPTCENLKQLHAARLRILPPKFRKRAVLRRRP
jgi:hypothetical protein